MGNGVNVSRGDDLAIKRKTGEQLPLPHVDWPRIGAVAPVVLDEPSPTPAPSLPPADVVVMTWTSAEWLALDHVFLNSAGTVHVSDHVSEDSWTLYDVGAPAHAGTQGGKLWCYFRLVSVEAASGTKRVLLIKSDSHLAHFPWFADLKSFTSNVIAQSGTPSLVISTGTAGGATTDARLGDVVVTASAHLELKIKDNVTAAGAANGTTVTSGSQPPTGRIAPVESQLLFPLSSVVTTARLQNAVLDAHKEMEAHHPKLDDSFTYDDLVNAPVDPTNLHSPKVIVTPNPILTTDWYYIAPGAGDPQWSALEMDDAVIGLACSEAGRDFAFVRNISDPLVPDARQDGTAIAPEAREAFSSAIYTAFGAYTSYNSALTTWALIAGL